jgi:hypothetical protein
MQESFGEGVASHTGPESCGTSRKGRGEALTGGRAGRAIEPRKHAPSSDGHFRGPTLLEQAEGHMVRIVSARCGPPLRGQRPTACPDTFHPGTGRSLGRLPRYRQTASRSPRTYGDDARSEDVGHVRSTHEGLEQCRTVGGGEAGGKGRGQRELAPTTRAPDTEPGGAPSALARVRYAARTDRTLRFTTLLHHIYDIDRLRTAYLALKRFAVRT